MLNSFFGFFTGWKAFGGRVQGLVVDGDHQTPPTRWWNHLWLRLFGWDTVVVFEAMTYTSFRVGYRDSRGKTYLKNEIFSSPVKGHPHFSMLVGHEPCAFFALEVETSRELTLKLIHRIERDYHNEPVDGPLI